MRTTWIAALLLAGCGAADSPPPLPVPSSPTAPSPTPTASEAAPVEATPIEPLASVRARSSCAFESVEALCEGLREHYLSASPGWVSDGCALGEPRTSTGPFAEVRLVGLRVGYDRIEGDARALRPLLTGTVREPAAAQGVTQLVLAARVGHAWFPIHLFHPSTEGEIPGHEVEWSLDDAGAFLTWTDHEGASRDADPTGHGETERTLAGVVRGVPMIAARATLERWRGELDLACARACNQAPSPPPPPGCSRQCASTVRATRSWERAGDAVRIGATELQREGLAQVASSGPAEDAETRRLDAPDDWLSFCAFMPVVRAVAAPAAADAESVAARDRARALVQRGAFRELTGARAAAVPGAPRATIELSERGGSACGGGGCSTAVRVRTIEGSMPEQGIGYFANERGNQVGCDPAALPDPGAATIVEVAPAISREAIGCGFAGYDGTAQRYWVIVRVLERAR